MREYEDDEENKIKPNSESQKQNEFNVILDGLDIETQEEQVDFKGFNEQRQ